MKVRIELCEEDLKHLVLQHIRRQLGDAGSQDDLKCVRIEVKSKMNFKSEWETAAFRAIYET